MTTVFLYAGDAFGQWTKGCDKGFFGFSFELEKQSDSATSAGTTVYGWAEVERLTYNQGKLIGWAYEDSGDPIQVGDAGAIPEPNTFALLALGAAGVTALRRRKSAWKSTG